LNRTGALLAIFVLLASVLVACTNPAALQPTIGGTVTLLAGQPKVVELDVRGLSGTPEFILQSAPDLLNVSMEYSDQKLTVTLTAPTDMRATNSAVTIVGRAGNQTAIRTLNLEIKELLLIRGSLDRQDNTADPDALSLRPQGALQLLAEQMGGVDVMMNQLLTPRLLQSSGRVSSMSPALQRVIRLLAEPEPVFGEYVVAIDSSGRVYGSDEANPDTGAWEISVYLNATEAAALPEFALLRGRSADDAEVAAGGADIVCIEPLEVAELLDSDSAFTRTRRTRALLLQYVANMVATQDAVDPTRWTRVLDVGSLATNDLSAKMANFDPSLFANGANPDAASPFLNDDGSFN
jgi:hypothetical protein